MFRKILIATDLSQASRPALSAGLELARLVGARVVALHVAETPYREQQWYMPFQKTDEEFLKSLGLRQMEAAHRAIEDEIAKAGVGGVSVETIVRTGIPADVIPGIAAEIGADLIVTGTHGRTGVEHALLGSIAERVVRRAGCPVLTVRS
jgi:nucleotide-binding universal stress UspA family protein